MPGKLQTFANTSKRRQSGGMALTHSEPSTRSSTPVLELEKRRESIVNGALTSLPLLVAPVVSLTVVPTSAAMQEAGGCDNGHGEGDSRPRQSDAEDGGTPATLNLPPPPRPASSNTLASHQGDLATDLGDTTEDESGGEVQCIHSEHRGLRMVDEVYPVDVNTLFDYLFTQSTFFSNLCSARKWTDMSSTPWLQEDGGCKTRTFAYTLPLNYTIGPRSSHNTEKQVCLAESRPGSVFMVDSVCTNQGVPYADNFSVVNHYCITRVSQYESRLRVHSEVVFRKNVWGFVKSFIEKNVVVGINDGFTFLRDYMRQHFVSRKELSPLIAPASAVPKQRVRRRLQSSERRQWAQRSVGTSVPSRSPSCTSTPMHPITNLQAPKYPTGDIQIRISIDVVVRIILAVLLVIFVVNGLLYYKLSVLETQASSLKSSSGVWQHDTVRRSAAHSAKEWTHMLNEQQQLQQREMERWRQVIGLAVDAVTEMEQRLRQLHDDVIKHVALAVSHRNNNSVSPSSSSSAASAGSLPEQ